MENETNNLLIRAFLKRTGFSAVSSANEMVERNQTTVSRLNDSSYLARVRNYIKIIKPDLVISDCDFEVCETAREGVCDVVMLSPAAASSHVKAPAAVSATSSAVASVYALAEAAITETSAVIPVTAQASGSVAVSTPASNKTTTDLTEEKAIIVLHKPLSRNELLNTILLLKWHREKMESLIRENETLKKSLEARKEIEKARGLLMKHLGLSEQEAFKRIQKQSMDRSIPMKEVATAIILAYDL